MVIIQLTGGLGNQLFQYAFGRALAIKNNTSVKLDLSFFEHYEWHEYSIAPFALQAELATKQEVTELKARDKSTLTKIARKLGSSRKYIFQEPDLRYDASFLNIQTPVYIEGYFQSELYFTAIEKEIRSELQLKPAPSVSSQHWLQKISGVNAVSLHIRRGNYVQVDFVNKVHGTCSLAYYQQAVQHMGKATTNPEFFVFSDDITWAKENLQIPFPTHFVDSNDDKTDYEDLRLMSSCSHHIIANSTFSWWGAWLNNKPNKIVIAPNPWFADAERNKQTKHLIPNNWLQL